METWSRAILGGGLGVLLFVTFIGGVVADRVARDYGTPSLIDWHQTWAPRPAGAASPTVWTSHLESMDQALAAQDARGARLAFREAYAAATVARSWEGLAAVADGSLRLGAAVGETKPAVARARELYLAALFRARQQDSVAGVLRATEAFAALGDREVVAQGLAVARELAAVSADLDTQARVQAFAER